ncbi:MAG: sensor histidine kinase [Kaiparowitsia implicata GSE-PSE-MK54-09C]|nr:sensor histidine kinase [Kaiparowitsia implicata GSE-PSE-MK54-09C]
MPTPILHRASVESLTLESTLAQLAQHEFQIPGQVLGKDVLTQFEHHPRVPGVVVTEQSALVGLVSRQRLLELLIRPQGQSLATSQPLSVLYRYVSCRHLILPLHTPILTAAQQAFRRSPDLQREPILVQINAQTFRLIDIHELYSASWQIRGIETQVRYERTQAQLIQSEKMAGLGRLVDGVAHEILDPVGFIWGNLAHISAYADGLMALLHAYEAQVPDPSSAIAHLQDQLELDYLRQDLPLAIDSVRTGADRLKRLATSLQNFCHIDEVYPKPANLHDCLDSILLLLKSRLTSDIQIVRHYGHLPPVTCYAGQLGQVFMNILTNAVDALLNQAIYQQWRAEFDHASEVDCAEALRPKPQITIQTQVRSLVSAPANSPRWVVVTIANNGPSLSDDQHERILASFTIERRAAKETSLGVSYQIVTAKHGGRLLLRSPTLIPATGDSSGTEFEIWLPLS